MFLFNKKLNYIGYDGNGSQVRDILNVEDLNKLIFYQIKKFNQFENDYYNVGGGQQIKFHSTSLQKYAIIYLKRKIISSIKQTRYGDIPYYVTNIIKFIKYVVGNH